MDKRKIKEKVVFNLPPIKNYSSRKEWEDVCWKIILKSRDLLTSVITPYERHNLIMRVVAMEKISAGKPYREISRELLLSLQTITSIKKIIERKNYRSYRERGKTERKEKRYTPNKSKIVFREKTIRTKYGRVRLP